MTPETRNKPRLKRNLTHAFSLIEILSVITIIGILSTLLIVGISHLKVSANRQQTHQLLQNCQALYNEYDATTHYHFDNFPLPSPANVTADVETQYEAANPTNPFGDRIGLMPVITRALFTQMRSMPNIRSGMDKFPSGRMFLPTTLNGGYIVYIGVPWQVGLPYTPGTSAVNYTVPNSTLPTTSYMCIHTNTGSDGTTSPSNAPPDPTCWFSLLGDPNVPIFLDAWGNPIIAVIGGTLGAVPNGTQYNGTGGASGFMYTYPQPGNVQTRLQIQVTSPDKRLFFASAGPDGDFSKADDNLYSFDSK